MEIKPLNKGPASAEDKGLRNAYAQLEALLRQLRDRELPAETVKAINEEVDLVNGDFPSEKAAKKQLQETQAKWLGMLEKKHQIVTKNHYRNKWLALGMAAFGLPIGVAIGASLGNLALLAIGLPVGMVIGLAVGRDQDRKAQEAGKQLDLEIE